MMNNKFDLGRIVYTEDYAYADDCVVECFAIIDNGDEDAPDYGPCGYRGRVRAYGMWNGWLWECPNCDAEWVSDDGFDPWDFEDGVAW